MQNQLKNIINKYFRKYLELIEPIPRTKASLEERFITTTELVPYNFFEDATSKSYQSLFAKEELNGLKEIKKLFDDIKDYANKKSIQNDLIFYILKKIYIDSNPKSPMKYFLYRKATKNSDKKFKEEMNMFLKSFVIFSRDSKIYQFLKRLKNNAK